VNRSLNGHLLIPELMELILAELRQVFDSLQVNFHPLIAIGVLYLIESIPVSAEMPVAELFSITLELAGCRDANVEDQAISTLWTLSGRLRTEDLLHVWEHRAALVNPGFLLGPMLALLQRSDAVPDVLYEQIIEVVFNLLEIDDLLFIDPALMVMVACFSRDANAFLMHQGRVCLLIASLLMNLSRGRVEALLHFLIGLRRTLEDVSSPVIERFVVQIIAASQLYELELEMEGWEGISQLLPFVGVDQLFYYVDGIPTDPVRYLSLIGCVIDRFPNDVYSHVAELGLRALERVTEPEDQDLIVCYFLKYCLIGRRNHQDLCTIIERYASDFFIHLIGICENGLIRSREAALHLAAFCILFDHPGKGDFLDFIASRARGEGLGIWQEGCVRLCAVLVAQGAIAATAA
jgi:hypothetical protein